MRSFHHPLLLLSSLVGFACSGAEESPDAARGTSPDVPVAESPGDTPATLSSPPDPRAGSLPRVVVLGTSLTAGYGLADPATQSWPARLEARAREAGIEIEVANAGVSGDTSAGGLRRVDWVLGQPADLLIVELGANDGLRGLPVDAMEANLDSIVARARRAQPDIRVALVPMEAPPNLGSGYTDDFRAAFVRVADRWDAVLLPFILDGIAGVPSLNQSDGIHPTAEGADLMAANVWDALLPLLRSVENDA